MNSRDSPSEFDQLHSRLFSSRATLAANARAPLAPYADAAERQTSACPSDWPPHPTEARLLALGAQLAAGDLAGVPPARGDKLPRDAYATTSLNAVYGGRACGSCTLPELAYVLGASDATLAHVLAAYAAEQEDTAHQYCARLLIRAINTGCASLVHTLLVRFNIEANSKVDGSSLLFMALRAAQIGVITLLLRCGASVTQSLKTSFAQIDFARLLGQIMATDSVVTLTLCMVLGVPVDWKDAAGRSLLHLACAAHAQVCIRHLLDSKASLGALDARGFTPAYAAIEGANATRASLPAVLRVLAGASTFELQQARDIFELKLNGGDDVELVKLGEHVAAHGPISLVNTLGALGCYNLSFEAMVASGFAIEANNLDALNVILEWSTRAEADGIIQSVFNVAMDARAMRAAEKLMRRGAVVTERQLVMGFMDLAQEQGASILNLHYPLTLTNVEQIARVPRLAELTLGEASLAPESYLMRWLITNPPRTLRVLRVRGLTSMGSGGIAALVTAAASGLRLHALDLCWGFSCTLDDAENAHVLITQLGLTQLKLWGNFSVSNAGAPLLAQAIAAPHARIETIYVNYDKDFSADAAEAMLEAARVSPSLRELEPPLALRAPERLRDVLHWNTVSLSALWSFELAHAYPAAFRARVRALFASTRAPTSSVPASHRFALAALKAVPVEMLVEIARWLAAAPAPRVKPT